MSSTKTTPQNHAAYQTSDNTPLVVRPAPYPTCAPNELIVKTYAIAINPVDAIMQQKGPELFPVLSHPFIMGCDVAGEVVEVGSSVISTPINPYTEFPPADFWLSKQGGAFRPGDRVTGMSTGVIASDSFGGSFQSYVVLPARATCRIPSHTTYEEACVLPLGLCTAAAGLFEPDLLALQYPSLTPTPTGKTVLVWGAATSVGSNAVQLAVSAGYEVIATASAKNFEYAKKLGASAVFDYNSPTVVDDIVRAFEDKESAGAIGCAMGSVETCLAILGSLQGGRKFLASAWFLPETLPDGVGAKFLQGETVVKSDVGPAVFERFLPQALKQGAYKCLPEAAVLPTKGLEGLQEGLERWRAGVSAKKIVVSILG